MKEHWGLVALGILAALVLFGALCGPGITDKYWVSRGEYDRAVKDAADQAEKDNALLVAQKETIARQDADIQARTARIQELTGHQAVFEGQLSDLTAQNVQLRANAQAAIDANPALQALVANFDLQIANLKDQVFTLKAQIAEDDAIIADWKAKYDAAVIEVGVWQARAEREAALRATCDSLRISLEGQLTFANRGGNVTLIGEAGVSALALAKGDPVPLIIFTGIEGGKRLFKLFIR